MIEGHPVRAADAPELSRFLTDVPLELHIAAQQGQTILIEGAHGFGASILYGEPTQTVDSDTTAQACCVRAGLGPTHVTDVLVVFPALAQDTPLGPDDKASPDAGKPAAFNMALARQASIVNGATALALTGIDKLAPRAHGALRRSHLPNEARQLIDQLEDAVGLPVALLSTGPAIEHVIDLR